MNIEGKYCWFCKRFTCLEETDYKNEDIGGVQTATKILKGKCKYCGRKMKAVEVVAIEEGNECIVHEK